MSIIQNWNNIVTKDTQKKEFIIKTYKIVPLREWHNNIDNYCVLIVSTLLQYLIFVQIWHNNCVIIVAILSPTVRKSPIDRAIVQFWYNIGTIL